MTFFFFSRANSRQVLLVCPEINVKVHHLDAAIHLVDCCGLDYNRWLRRHHRFHRDPQPGESGWGPPHLSTTSSGLTTLETRATGNRIVGSSFMCCYDLLMTALTRSCTSAGYCGTSGKREGIQDEKTSATQRRRRVEVIMKHNCRESKSDAKEECPALWLVKRGYEGDVSIRYGCAVEIL